VPRRAGWGGVRLISPGRNRSRRIVLAVGEAGRMSAGVGMMVRKGRARCLTELDSGARPGRGGGEVGGWVGQRVKSAKIILKDAKLVSM
jgi:hypothetical protein